jgi:hypothetical protein
VAETLYKISSDYFPTYSACDNPEEGECKKECIILDLATTSLSQMALIIIPYINLFSVHYRRKKGKNNLSRTKIFFHFFLLCLIILCTYILNYLSFPTSENNNKRKAAISCLFSTQSLQIIFIVLISRFLLKYNYFIHHLLSIILEICLTVSVDLILKNFSKDIFPNGSTFAFIASNFLMVLFESINLIYKKYMMEKYYYSPWTLSVVSGGFGFAWCILIMIFSLFITIPNFPNYISTVNPGIIIAKFFIDYIIDIFKNILMYLVLFNFAPNYYVISTNLSHIFMIIVEYDDNRKYYCIGLFILEFLCVLINLEIIILNFCGLEKNTAKFINQRSERDTMMGKVDDNYLYEISPGYLIDKSKKEEVKVVNSHNPDLEMKFV